MISSFCPAQNAPSTLVWHAASRASKKPSIAWAWQRLTLPAAPDANVDRSTATTLHERCDPHQRQMATLFLTFRHRKDTLYIYTHNHSPNRKSPSIVNHLDTSRKRIFFNVSI